MSSSEHSKPHGSASRWLGGASGILLSRSAPAVFRPRQPPQLGAWHVLFLIGMMIIVIPIAFMLDPMAGQMHGDWPAGLSYLARSTTQLGKAQWVLIPTGLVVIASWLVYKATVRSGAYLPSRVARICAYMFASTGFAEIFSSFLKSLFGRARPQLFDTLGTYALDPISFSSANLSFPSGHATAVGATCTAIALLAPRLRWVVLPVGLWLGLTRVLTGAHYPSDVIVGLVLGAYIAVFMSMIFMRYGWLNFPKPLGTRPK
jgi:membrane-associated phospholipid phosphatase